VISGTVNGAASLYPWLDVTATFDVHRLTEHTTLIIASGDFDAAGAEALAAAVAEPLATSESIVLSLAQCPRIDREAIGVCDHIAGTLESGQHFVVVIDERNEALSFFERDRVRPIAHAPTIAAAVRFLAWVDA